MIRIIICIVLTLLVLGCASSKDSIKKISCTKDEWRAYYNSDNYLEPMYLKRSFEEVSFMFGCHAGKIYRAYKPYWKERKIGSGKIVFVFTIYPTGHISDLSVKSSEIDNPEFIAELKNIVTKIRFVSKEVEKMVVTYPIDFKG